MRTMQGDSELQDGQKVYARVAGILFLGAIVLAFGCGALLSKIAGDGSFAETASRIAASERMYRVALSGVLLVTLSSSVLAFALYVTLKRVDGRLALLGMIFCLGDSCLGLMVRACGFVRLHLYVSAHAGGAGAMTAESLNGLMRTIGGTTENIGGIAFGIGSCLFFYLFTKSRVLPRVISVFGLIASLLWTGMYFASLIYPERRPVFQYVCFPPMALAEVATGIWLTFFPLGRGIETATGAATAGLE